MPVYRLVSPKPVDPDDRVGTEQPFEAPCISDAVNLIVARFEQWPSVFNARGGQTASVTVVNADNPDEEGHGTILFHSEY